MENQQTVTVRKNILDTGVGPFRGILDDQMKTLESGRRFRIILYCAHSAMGMIGTERNGVGILDEDAHQVLVDNIEVSEPMDVPTERQKAMFQKIMAMPTPDFMRFVNEHPNARYSV